MNHDLLNLFANIIVFGLVLWLVDRFLPLPSIIKTLLRVLVLVILVIFVLQFFGLVHTSLQMYPFLR